MFWVIVVAVAFCNPLFDILNVVVLTSVSRTSRSGTLNPLSFDYYLRLMMHKAIDGMIPKIKKKVTKTKMSSLKKGEVTFNHSSVAM